MRKTIIVFSLVFLGCSSGSVEGDLTSGDVTAGGDTVWSDTPSDSTSIEVAYPKECEKDEDCADKALSLGKDPANFACNCNYECIEVAPIKDGGCHLDKNCGSEAYCDPCTKTCKPKLLPCQPCTSDIQCDPDTRCVDSFSYMGIGITMKTKVCAPLCLVKTRVCTVEGAPPGSFVCADADVGDPAYGACIPISLNCEDTVKKCHDDSDCADPKKEKCWPDLHICGCRDTLSCDFGYYCNKHTHKCVEGCTSDTQCGAEKVCEAGECQEACTGSLANGNVKGCPEELPQGFEDKAYDCINGHCKIPGMCFQPIDCHEKENYCDAETHTCKPGCLFDFDCKSSAKICDTSTYPGKCVDRGCTGNFECGCGEVCKLDEEKCVPAEGKYCEPCDQQKGEEACGDKSILCIGFKDPETNEDKGSYCMPPCSPDPENPCPQGWQCQEVKDDKGISHGKVCIRFCYREVAGGCAIGQPKPPESAEGTIPDP